MNVKITMIGGEIFNFRNPDYQNVLDFIEGQLHKNYYVIFPKGGLAIRTCNILKIETEKEETK